MDVLKGFVSLFLVCVVSTSAQSQETSGESFVASKKMGPAPVNFDDFLPIFNYQPPTRDAERGLSIFAPTSFQFMTHHNSQPSGRALENNYNAPMQNVYPDVGVGQFQPYSNQYPQVGQPFYKYSDSAPVQNPPGLDTSSQFTPSFGPPANLGSPQYVPESYNPYSNVETPRFVTESYSPPTSNFETSTPKFPLKTPTSYISNSQNPSSELGLSKYANTSPGFSSEVYEPPQRPPVTYAGPSLSIGSKYTSPHKPSSLPHEAPPKRYNPASNEHSAEEDNAHHHHHHHQKNKQSLEQSEDDDDDDDNEEEDAHSSEPQHVEEESDEDSESTSPAHLEEPYHKSEDVKVPHFYPSSGSSYHQGSGNQYKKSEYEGHGHSGLKKGSSSHHHDEKNRGNHDKIHEAGEHGEKGRNKNNYHDEAGHFKNHRDEGKRFRGAKFGEKKGHRKGHKTKGYHNKFFKDEYHKEHKFYDDYHKKGRFNKFGDFKANRYHNEGAYKKGGKEDGGHHSKAHGKKGAFAEGHYDKEDEGFDKKEGDNQYHKHYRNYGKMGGNNSGKTYGFRTP